VLYPCDRSDRRMTVAKMSLPELTVFDGWVPDPILLEQLYETVKRDFEEKRGLPQSRRCNWWNG